MQEQVLRTQRRNAQVWPIWLTTYPICRVYPNTLVVSTVCRAARSMQHIVEFYYPEDIVLFEREYVERRKEPITNRG